MRRRRRLIPVGAALAVSLLLSPEARGATVKVTASGTGMEDSKFTPRVVVIAPGDTVEWDAIEGTHNVVSDDDLFLSGSVVPAPWTFSHTFDTTGAFRYYCSSHGGPGGIGQSGIVVVRPAHASNEAVYEILAWEFAAGTTATFSAGPEEAMRSVTSPATQILAPVHLPTGVQITGIELTGCDDSATDDMGASLDFCADPDAACEIIASVATSGQPGCGFFDTSVAEGPVIANAAGTYLVSVQIGGGTALRFRNVRLFYKKVISPAPLTATFADVPTTDLAFRAIEALAASGITSGCGPGQFCPTVTVTRAQMALFLARALGLFWPN